MIEVKNLSKQFKNYAVQASKDEFDMLHDWLLTAVLQPANQGTLQLKHSPRLPRSLSSRRLRSNFLK